MLTDMRLRALKPTRTIYKVADQQGLYVAVTRTGVVSFRFDYRINGRRETLVLGQYDSTLGAKKPRDPDELDYGMSLTLAEARLLMTRARRSVERGESPSRDKAEKRVEAAEALTFGRWAEKYFAEMHDLRRTASTLLHEAGFNSDWIEKCLAHEQRGVRAVYDDLNLPLWELGRIGWFREYWLQGPRRSLELGAGRFRLGSAGGEFAFDSELRAYEVEIAAFAIDSRAVCWQEFCPSLRTAAVPIRGGGARLGASGWPPDGPSPRTKPYKITDRDGMSSSRLPGPSRSGTTTGSTAVVKR